MAETILLFTKPLQMTPNVKKIILSISVWPVHLWTGIIQGNISVNVRENKSGIHPPCLLLLPHSRRCESWGSDAGRTARLQSQEHEKQEFRSGKRLIPTVRHQYHFPLFLRMLVFYILPQIMICNSWVLGDSWLSGTLTIYQALILQKHWWTFHLRSIVLV